MLFVGVVSMELKRNELELLGFFRRNARLALTKISKQTGVPVSTIFDKLRRYEQEFIQRHVALIDFQKLGFNTRANIFLKTTPEHRERLGLFLKLHPNVNAVFRINNGFDYMVEGVFRSIQDQEQFLETLELEQFVISREVYFIIAEVAREQFLANIEQENNKKRRIAKEIDINV